MPNPDFRKMELEYAAANNSFYIVRNKKLLTFKPDKMPVGKYIGEETDKSAQGEESEIGRTPNENRSDQKKHSDNGRVTDPCPECGEQLRRQQSCVDCVCGYSKC